MKLEEIARWGDFFYPEGRRNSRSRESLERRGTCETSAGGWWKDQRDSSLKIEFLPTDQCWLTAVNGFCCFIVWVCAKRTVKQERQRNQTEWRVKS